MRNKNLGREKSRPRFGLFNYLTRRRSKAANFIEIVSELGDVYNGFVFVLASFCRVLLEDCLKDFDVLKIFSVYLFHI